MISRADRWVGLDLRHLHALEAVAASRSFAGAAKQLGYTQPAVSQQIAALERIVGQRLVERDSGRRRVVLTEAGDVLLRHAQSIGARLSAAQADMDALADGSAGTMRVGTFQSVAAQILPALVQRFRREWPDVHVELEERDDDGELIALVEAGELDLAFVMLPLTDAPLEAVELMRDPFVLMVAEDSPLAKRRTPPTAEEIGELSLVAYRQCRSAPLAEAQLRARGVEPHVVFRSDDNGTVQSFVGAGLGAAIVPALAVDPSDERVAILDIGDEVSPRVIAIAWHRDRYRSRAAERFVELARELCAELTLPEPRRYVRRNRQRAPAGSKPSLR